MMSVIAGFSTLKLISSFMPLFIKAGLFGCDMSKISKARVPEPMGLICAAMYLVVVFLFIPFPFIEYWMGHQEVFPHHQFSQYMCAVLAICTMIFLGFADDVVELRWRHKLILPTIATLPILTVYLVTGGSTYVTVPNQLQFLLGDLINLGILYYVYMGLIVVFCTNAINIYAGINGLESGQSVVIALSILCNSIIQLLFFNSCHEGHLLSVYLITPFIGTSIALFYYNSYPSQVFVGDTFCYFAGMTFAAVGILSHSSKTLVLFFLPQLFNFIYSIPQLFRVIPCPRHRLPKFNPETGLMDISTCRFKPDSLSLLGRICFKLLTTFRLATVKKVKKDDDTVEMNNLTLINIALIILGPTNEGSLASRLLFLQVLSSGLGFLIRYYASQFFYTVIS